MPIDQRAGLRDDPDLADLDVRGLVIDDDAVGFERPRKRPARARYLDLHRRQPLELPQDEVEPLLRVQQPMRQRAESATSSSDPEAMTRRRRT